MSGIVRVAGRSPPVFSVPNVYDRVADIFRRSRPGLCGTEVVRESIFQVQNGSPMHITIGRSRYSPEQQRRLLIGDGLLKAKIG